jgi:hypothetical protein
LEITLVAAAQRGRDGVVSGVLENSQGSETLVGGECGILLNLIHLFSSVLA